MNRAIGPCKICCLRLSSCIFIEALAGAAMMAGASLGLYRASELVRAEFAQEAIAAEIIDDAPRMRADAPPLTPFTELNYVAASESTGMFMGVADEVLLAPLRDSPVTQVKFNKGGSSISLRIDFANGARAAFKPRQINWQSVPRREVVAFRLNRLLGLSSVPPAIGRRFTKAELLEHLHPESTWYRPRLQAEMIEEDGYVLGELSWWIPVIERGRIDGFDIDSMEGIVSWKRMLTVGADIPEAHRALIAQISNMVLFDLLISNPDRWSGGNARVSEDQTILYFMDNTLSFGDNQRGHPKARTYFERCQVFSRSLVGRLRALRESDVRAVLASDVEPFDFYLYEEEITALMSRRDRALEYIDSLVALYGDQAVLAFP